MWGVWAPGASVPCGGGAGAPPFAGPGLIARVGKVVGFGTVLNNSKVMGS